MNAFSHVPLATRKNMLAAAAAVGLLASAGSASAAFIVASNDCPGGTGCEPTAAGDTYGFEFRIDDTESSNVFGATLTNTSPATSDALIDLLAFNMNPDLTLGTDFTIINVSPTWTFTQTSGGGIQFDYVGERTSPETRLEPGESLTFDFNFSVALPDNPFDLWLTAETSSGIGAGGGTDIGQVAVSFQNLLGQEGSDLLPGNWDAPEPPFEIPEPTTLALLGLGLMGLAAARRKSA